MNGDPREVPPENWALLAQTQRYEPLSRGEPNPWSVAKTVVGDVTVSTVFLGLDVVGRSGQLFETMIFVDRGFSAYGPHGGEMWRYLDRQSALAGHEHAVELAELARIRDRVADEPLELFELVEEAAWVLIKERLGVEDQDHSAGGGEIWDRVGSFISGEILGLTPPERADW